MRNPKMNRSPRYVQGLIVFVCLLLLVLSTGTAEARYRAEKNTTTQFLIAEPAQIYLGTLSDVTTEGQGEDPAENKMIFNPEGLPVWTETRGIHSMELAVSNGASEEIFSAKDQQFRLQMIGSIGLGTEESFPKLELQVPSEEDPEAYETFQAIANRIKEGSTLYHSVGEGWIIRFQNEEGQEPLWILEGGALSYKRFIITMEDVLTDSNILLQPQAEAKVVPG